VSALKTTDPGFARNIDDDVYRSIIEDVAFKHFVEIKASDLGVRLQDALSKLWMRSSVSSVVSEGSDISACLSDHLARVFSKAIDVQCRLRVSGRRFRYIWYAPGQVVDREYMTVTGGPGSGDEWPSRVSLTLWPGISEILDETNEGGVSGFSNGCTDTQAQSCLVRAVIV
jgi:hypothetical protein